MPKICPKQRKIKNKVLVSWMFDVIEEEICLSYCLSCCILQNVFLDCLFLFFRFSDYFTLNVIRWHFTSTPHYILTCFLPKTLSLKEIKILFSPYSNFKITHSWENHRPWDIHLEQSRLTSIELILSWMWCLWMFRFILQIRLEAIFKNIQASLWKWKSGAAATFNVPSGSNVSNKIKLLSFFFFFIIQHCLSSQRKTII